MIWGDLIKLTCNHDVLFILAVQLVFHGGDCTVICENPLDLSSRFGDSKYCPAHWAGPKYLGDYCFGMSDGGELLTFVSPNNYKDDYGYTFVIDFREK